MIGYSVNETEVINYTVEITGDNVSFIINNTHVIELINVTVIKVWNDGNNISGKRPDNVTVVLFADGNAIRNATLSVSTGWTHTFEGLDKFKNNGTLIKYSIAEVNVGVPGYTTNITNSTPYYWIVNNTYVPDVNKTANKTKAFYNESVVYYITITNIGTGIYNETLVIVDSLPYGLEYNETISITGARVLQNATYDEGSNNITWIITDIDPSVPAIISVLVRTYDIGNLTNNVTLIGPNGFNKTVNYTIEVEPIVDVAVNKTVDNELHYINDIVVWTIRVSNAYNGTNATDVVMSDILPAEFEFINYTATVGNYDAVSGVWYIGFMGNGTEETLRITSRARAVGTFINFANVTCNETEWNYANNFDNATVTVEDLGLEKLPDKNVTYYHDDVLFNLTVINDGEYDFTRNVTVVDNLPDGIIYIKTVDIIGADVVQSAVLSNNNRTVTWVITNITANSTAVIIFNANTTSVGPKLNPETIIFDNGLNKTVNCTIEVLPIVDVAVNKTVDNELHYINDIVVWTIRVSNAYNGTNATDVVMSDILPAEFEFINYTATVGNYDAVSGVWYIGFMGNGTEETLRITSRARAVGTFINFANVTCNETEWNYANNFDNATVTVEDLGLEKLPDKNVTYYHDDVLFNLTVINDGEYDFTRNVTVVDNLPDGIIYIKTVDIIGADVVQSAVLSNNNRTVTWVITNITANSTAVIIIRTNTTSVGPKLNPETIIFDNGYNKTVNCTIDVLPIVDVSVVKTSDKAVYYVDDIVVWTIKVSNAFNGTDATDVRVQDILPSEFTFIDYDATKGTYEDGVWTIGFMGNGTEETLIIVSLANSAVVNATNEANVSCNETEWNYDNNYDNATVTVFINPPPFKYVNNTKPFHHENVIYYLTATNVGPVTFENELLVIDSLPDGVDYIRTLRITGADVLMNATRDGNKIYWVITNISAGSTAVIEVLAQANAIGVKVNNETLVYPDGSNKTVNATIEVQPIDVSVVKTSDKDSYFMGDIVVWTIKVSNAFNGYTATDVKMNDVLPAGFTLIDSTATKGSYANGVWTIGEMLKGTEETLTIYSLATTEGTFTNYANVTCNETEWNYTNNFDNKTVDVKKNPDIEKTVNNTKPYHYEFVEYYLTITNTEEIDYTNSLVVIDSLPDGLVYADTLNVEGATLVNTVVYGQIITWTLKDIKAKSSAVITVKVFVDGLGDLTNNGTLVPAYGNNITVNCTITPIPIADLEVIKLSDGKKPNTHVYSKGNTVTWTIKVINHGPDDAVNAVAADFLPSGLIYISDDSQGAFDHNTGIWNIGNLAKGESVILNIVTNISITNARITNNVDVTSETYDPNETNNHDNNTIRVAPEADLEIAKLVSQATSRANDIITWTIIVKNNGPDTAVNAVVSDKLPSGVVYVSDDSNGAYNHNTGVWKLGNLAKGKSKVLHIKTKVIGTNRTITNFANVTSDTPDPDESNNKDNNTTKVGPVADLMIIKDVNKDTVKVGDKVEFTIVVRNLGPDTAVNTRAYDVLPDGLKLISFKVSRGTYDPVTGIWNIGDMAKGDSATLSIVAKALVVGEIVNEAYVESDTYDNNTSNNYDNATVTVVNVTEPPEPPVSILKLYPTGNPLVMVLLALLTIVGVSIRRRN